jgi:hypothetical protein
MSRTNRALSEMDGVCSMRGSGFSSHRPLYKRICPTALYAPISVQNELTHLSLLGLARLRLSPVSLIVDMDAGSERDSVQTKNTIHTHVSGRWSTDEETGGGVALTRTLSTAPARAGASQPSVASATTGFWALAARERGNQRRDRTSWFGRRVERRTPPCPGNRLRMDVTLWCCSGRNDDGTFTYIRRLSPAFGITYDENKGAGQAFLARW